MDTNDWCTTTVPEVSIANFCSYKYKFLQIMYLGFNIDKPLIWRGDLTASQAFSCLGSSVVNPFVVQTTEKK